MTRNNVIFALALAFALFTLCSPAMAAEPVAGEAPVNEVSMEVLQPAVPDSAPVCSLAEATGTTESGWDDPCAGRPGLPAPSCQCWQGCCFFCTCWQGYNLALCGPLEN